MATITAKPAAPAAQTSHPVYTDLRAVYLFEEGSGTSVNDEIGSEDLVMAASPTWGGSAGLRYLNPSTAYKIHNSTIIPNGQAAFSVGWVGEYNGATTFRDILAWIKTSNFQIRSNNPAATKLQAIYRDGGTGNATWSSASAGSEYFLLVTVDSSANETKLWIDGTEVASSSNSIGAFSDAGFNQLRINNGDAHKHYGLFIWDDVLGSSARTSWFADPWGVVTPPLGGNNLINGGLVNGGLVNGGLVA